MKNTTKKEVLERFFNENPEERENKKIIKIYTVKDLVKYPRLEDTYYDLAIYGGYDEYEVHVMKYNG